MPQDATIEERVARLEKGLGEVHLTVARLTPVPYNYGVEVVTGLRDLNTDFIVSSVRDAQVSYTIEMVTSATGAGANDSSATVELYVNGVVVHSAKNRIVATLTAILGLLGITLSNNTQRWVLSGYVPAGATVNITTSGTGTMTILSVQEVLV